MWKSLATVSVSVWFDHFLLALIFFFFWYGEVAVDQAIEAMGERINE